MDDGDGTIEVIDLVDSPPAKRRRLRNVTIYLVDTDDDEPIEVITLGDSLPPSRRGRSETLTINMEVAVNKTDRAKAESDAIKVGACLKDVECNICLEYLIDPMVLNCKHSFCEHCINVWCRFKKTCPICRAQINYISKGFVLENVIENLVKFLTPAEIDHRKMKIEEREFTLRICSYLRDKCINTDERYNSQ